MPATEPSPGIRVPLRKGEAFRKALVSGGALDPSRKVCSDRNYVYLPVKELDRESLQLIAGLGEYEPISHQFAMDRRRVTVEDLLGRRTTYEVVGDIAIVEDPEEKRAAEAIMAVHHSVRTAIAPESEVEGEFRTRRFRHVAGEERTTTTHREHGLQYRIDLQGAYFTPRLGTERLRVAEQIEPGQTVLDMFAGVGPFALLYARRGARVVAVDKNPVAVSYLRENARLNRLEVEIREGDAAALALEFRDSMDRVIMNLPHCASRFLEPAMLAAKDGGVIHYYTFAPDDDLYRDRKVVEEAAVRLGFRVEFLYQGVVRSYSPRQSNVVLDFQVVKSGVTSIAIKGSRN
ncbi:MAG: class I SAM-dependent methyltransferase family protein [Methanosarcinales archaeon]|nr:class I SAM-dependent methyltransferase family protein [Methanosarcinales archaeon]